MCHAALLGMLVFIGSFGAGMLAACVIIASGVARE